MAPPRTRADGWTWPQPVDVLKWSVVIFLACVEVLAVIAIAIGIVRLLF